MMRKMPNATWLHPTATLSGRLQRSLVRLMMACRSRYASRVSEWASARARRARMPSTCCCVITDSSTTNVQVLFGVLSIIISFYIMRLIATFIAAVNGLDEEDLNLLRSPNNLGRHHTGFL